MEKVRKDINKLLFMKYLVCTLTTFLALDIVGFIAWALSGQLPEGNVYLGAITRAVVSLVI